MMAPVTAVVIGAGNRGLTYSNYALDFPEKFKVYIILLFLSVWQKLFESGGRARTKCWRIEFMQNFGFFNIKMVVLMAKSGAKMGTCIGAITPLSLPWFCHHCVLQFIYEFSSLLLFNDICLNFNTLFGRINYVLHIYFIVLGY